MSDKPSELKYKEHEGQGPIVLAPDAKPKYSVVMTVFDRPQIVLINTLNAIGRNDFQNIEILIVNDASTIPYKPLMDSYRGLPIRWIDISTTKDRPGTYHIDGYNNPAYAYNRGVDEARGEYIFMMCSDVMIQPRTIALAKQMDLEKIVWMPAVYDLDSGQQFLGDMRLTPFGWFFGASKKVLQEVRWDEEYLKGIAFEDNDFMARLACHVGRFVIDTSCIAWHQSHKQTAYSDDLAGWRINKAYTEKKWGGIPWDNQAKNPLSVKKTAINNQIILDVERKEVEAVVR